MMQRFHRLSLAGFLLGATLTASAQTTPPTPAPGSAAASVTVNDGQPVTITINDGSIDHMLGLVEAYTGRVLLRPPNLPPAKYTLKLDKPMPKPEAMLAVETLLNLNGVGLVPLGDKFIKVVPIQQVRYEAPEIISGSALELPASGRVATKIFQLDFIRAAEFLQQFSTLFNPNLGTQPVPFEKTNAVMVTDSVSTLQRIELLLQQIDHPSAVHNGLKFYTARHAKASDLVNKLRGIMQGGLQQQMGNNISLNADDRTNQIVLISDPRQHAFFDTMIEKLDIKADPNTRNEVIYLKHAASKDVATLISNIVSEKNKATTSGGSVRSPLVNPTQPPLQPAAQQPASPQGAPADAMANALLTASSAAASQEFSANITIQSDERSNALVVAGTVDDIRIIRELVDKIDILLAQVRIEVVIAQVNLDDSESTGLSSLNLAVKDNVVVGFNNLSTPGMGVGPLPGTGLGALNDAFATVSKTNELTALINLATNPGAQKSKALITSVPSITTTHNKEAQTFVGEQRSIITGQQSNQTTTNGIINSFTPTEIGTKLKVKPLIGGDGSVQLEVEQEISDVTKEPANANEPPVIGKTSNKSFISVKSGQIIVLGGLQRQKNLKSRSRFGPIPIIGDLLGPRTSSENRQEIIFFLRPTVLTNTPEDNVQALQQTDALPIGKSVREKLNLPPATAPEPKPAPSIKRPR